MKNRVELCLLTPIDIMGMSKKQRQEYIESVMQSDYLGKQFFCPALGVYLHVTKRGIHETAQHASKSIESTIASLNLPQVIEYAQFVESYTPKIGTQTKKFKAKRTYELTTYLGQLKIKLIVIKTTKAVRVEYCVTAKKRSIPTIIIKKSLNNALKKAIVRFSE